MVTGVLAVKSGSIRIRPAHSVGRCPITSIPIPYPAREPPASSAREPAAERLRQACVTTRARFLSIATILTVALAGCSGGASLALDGHTFLSTAVTEGGRPRELVPGTQIRLTFGPDGRLGASAGCNILGGTYRLEGDVLRLDGGAMTEMGCDDARHAQDDWLFAFLGTGPTLMLAGNDLVLAAGGVVVRLLDREVAEPDLRLVGPTWTVESIISGDAVASMPQGVVATLAFGADGRVRFTTGCNEGGATMVVDGGTLHFSAITLTKRACEGPADAMEAAILGVLGADVITYRIDAGSLTLEAQGRGLGLRAS